MAETLYRTNAKSGDEVKFLGQGGFPFQLELAKKHLKAGEIYTLELVHVDDWGIYYYLKEVPNKSFPEDMFERL